MGETAYLPLYEEHYNIALEFLTTTPSVSQ